MADNKVILLSVFNSAVRTTNMALLGEDTILTPFEALGDAMFIRPLVVGVLVLLSAFFVIRLLNSDFGLGLRATGVNARMHATPFGLNLVGLKRNGFEKPEIRALQKPPIPLLITRNALNLTDFSEVIISDNNAINIMVSNASDI